MLSGEIALKNTIIIIFIMCNIMEYKHKLLKINMNNHNNFN